MMPDVTLSPRQRHIYTYLQGFFERHEIGPTIREIQRACEYSSPSVVHYNLDRLAEQGLITVTVDGQRHTPTKRCRIRGPIRR